MQNYYVIGSDKNFDHYTTLTAEGHLPSLPQFSHWNQSYIATYTSTQPSGHMNFSNIKDTKFKKLKISTKRTLRKRKSI